VALVEPDLLRRTAELAIAHLEALPSRPVGATRRAAEIHAALAAPLPEEGIAPERVVEELVRDTDGGLVASPGGRYFGFVTGGVLPAALAADWLASAWDQNAFSAVSSPALAAIEAVAADWIKDVLGLPSGAGVGFTTGAQMANVTGLAVARQVMLARAGWDVAQRGLIGAPPLTVVVGEEAHVTVLRALRLLGLGSGAASVVPSDDQGRMRADALGPALDAAGGPAIVCTQAGNVNSGASDPFQ
jgi:glutamate/tyrosine decarboxylase-like PLP-dependent enzyme